MIFATLLGISLLIIFFFLLVISLKKKIHYWIIRDIFRYFEEFIATRSDRTLHIMFCMADHFEPGNRNADLKKQKARVDTWIERYPKLASSHQDSDGVCPQHTFFFPPHYDTDNHLRRIVELCGIGYGEVEMHLHHDRQSPWPDNELSLERKIKDCILSFSRHKVFCLPDGQKTFGFIHGDWALGNSLKGSKHCGVDSELSVLYRTGCYADFTFPVCNEAQPKLPNTFFYSRTDQIRPKLYNIRPVPVKTGVQKPKDTLMVIQGIIGLRWKSRTHKFKPSIEQSNLDVSDYPFRRRIDYWIKKGVHVKGKREWVFVKIHTHGAREEDMELLLGQKSHDMYTYLETAYNDGKKYVLHYVSAREMYNIAKAAEAGRGGNPGKYRDFVIPRYCYLPQRDCI